MDALSQKTKKRLLILPIIPITIVIIYSVILDIVRISDEIFPFLDYHFFQQAFNYFPHNIYENFWYIYTPAFFIEFFWIGFVSFYVGVAIWISLKIIIIQFVWKKILYSEEMRNLSELIVFVILVLIIGMMNDINMANSDTILLACGFLGYLSLDKAQKIQGDELYSNKHISKNQAIVLLNAFAGFITAFGMFKPIFFIFFPLLLLKSNRKFVFISLFCIWLFASNYLIIFHPEYIIKYIERSMSGQTMLDQASRFNSEILNTIFRNGFTPFRIQIWLFPAVMFYIHEFVKNEKIRKNWAYFYFIGIMIFNSISLILFWLGF